MAGAEALKRALSDLGGRGAGREGEAIVPESLLHGLYVDLVAVGCGELLGGSVSTHAWVWRRLLVPSVEDLMAHQFQTLCPRSAQL